MTETISSGRWLAPMPERVRRSRLPVSLSTMPTTMNSAALNSPWASSIAAPASAASSVPRPLIMIRKPSWETVP